MIEEKLVRLIEQLYQRTKEGKLKWNRAIEDKTFQVSFSDYTVQIEEDQSRIGPMSSSVHAEQSHSIRILDGNGDVVEYLWDSELPEGQKLVEPLREIYNIARRSAMKAENAYDSILAQLEKR